MNLGDIMNMFKKISPKAYFDFDSNGQIVIFTHMALCKKFLYCRMNEDRASVFEEVENEPIETVQNLEDACGLDFQIERVDLYPLFYSILNQKNGVSIDTFENMNNLVENVDRVLDGAPLEKVKNLLARCKYDAHEERWILKD